ncbi:opioid growth factor receptor isoform X1 [Oryzias melastigma]|uniref:opioid growth factor receptor isoform X1 n=1 Tax=Oryzias melastigma TaxID=30732 RepID=UPI000CF80AF3|nr:opioid growth factor receptor isoform X1 [Oryzias melastigma]
MMDDDCVCEYDSTWDTESDGDDPAGESQTRRSNQDKNKSAWAIVRASIYRPTPRCAAEPCRAAVASWHHTPRNMRAARDMQNYRRGYPNLTDDECSEDKMNNLQFYLNKFPSAPDDIYIDSFLKEWRNDYKRLERVHSYIQWLFPLREPGVNYMASELTKKEIEEFRKNEVAKRRLVESYELMLGFYGIRLVNKETGEVKRAENWKERFGNLERNMHNNLRITRILKSLGELGFEHYQAPLVRFFLEETLVKKTLSSVKRSVLDYFLFAVLNKQKRQELVRFAYLHFEPKDKFVWCPRKIQKQLRKAEKRLEAVGNGDGKEEVLSRSKNKDGDTGVQQKEEGGDNKPQKGGDKSKDRSKQPETEPVGNGNASTESESELRNGSDSSDDVLEMDQSPNPDVTTVQADPSTQTCTTQEADIMQTDADVETEKPAKKKKDDQVPPNSSSAAEDAPQLEDKTVCVTGPTSPSLQTPPKSSKHSPSRSSEREGKIPRTDFSQAPAKMEEEESSPGSPSATKGKENVE